MRLAIEGIGLRGPGLAGWTASRPILAGADYQPAPTNVAPSDLLPPNERRRAVQTVKLALAVGAEAFAMAGRDPLDTATIFTSSGGDGETIDQILNVLASPDRDVSPTRFHNSVHNAPAGYWSIATGSRAPSSSLCCHDDSFAAGLLEAAAQVFAEQRPVALIAYDVCYPLPLGLARPIGASFAVALILVPAPTPVPPSPVMPGQAHDFSAGLESAANSVPRLLRLSLGPAAPATAMPVPALETLRQNTPAARALPLLAALARHEPAEIILDYLSDMALTLNLSPEHIPA